jgi:hypothetical protein
VDSAGRDRLVRTGRRRSLRGRLLGRREPVVPVDRDHREGEHEDRVNRAVVREELADGLTEVFCDRYVGRVALPDPAMPLEIAPDQAALPGDHLPLDAERAGIGA